MFFLVNKMPKFKQNDLIIYNHNGIKGAAPYLVLSYSRIMDCYKVIRPDKGIILKFKREDIEKFYKLYKARKGHPLTNIFN